MLTMIWDSSSGNSLLLLQLVLGICDPRDWTLRKKPLLLPLQKNHRQCWGSQCWLPSSTSRWLYLLSRCLFTCRILTSGETLKSSRLQSILEGMLKGGGDVFWEGKWDLGMPFVLLYEYVSMEKFIRIYIILEEESDWKTKRLYFA